MDKTGIVLGALSILAILLGPIFALEIQRRLDRGREAKNRKMWVFKTLMSYRATNLSPVFVQALNLIDVEFDGNNDEEKAVRKAWKVLLDHFSDLGAPEPPSSPLDRAASLTANLLLAMGKCLGYDFDEVHIKKGAYYSKGLGSVEEEQHALRRELLELLNGTRKLPIAVFGDTFPDLIPEPTARPAPAAKAK